MSEPRNLLSGEFRRSLDERFRLLIPIELMDQLGVEEPECLLAKERPGCVSVWLAKEWQAKLETDQALLADKWRAGKFDDRLPQLQLLGRLMSTRHRTVKVTERGRLLIPEGFREFLRVEPGSDVMVVGAAACIEIWNPSAWVEYLEDRMPRFRKLLDRLSR
jgi:MraZ protein